ncbi:hypothetical protein [Streptomyces enissocaesilis]|uniref:Uncharacterized protein n=1 Tax=Streptomyces enissocaesilis TaxID=332589 RepID=A0ABP6JYL4_9ACTN
MLDGETNVSTGTRSRLIRRVIKTVEAAHGEGVVPLPSTRTLYKVIDALATGRHAFGSAVTRRQTANRSAGPFTPTFADRPGEQVQIDSTRWTSWWSWTRGDRAGRSNDRGRGRHPHHRRGGAAAGGHQGGGRLAAARAAAPLSDQVWLKQSAILSRVHPVVVVRLCRRVSAFAGDRRDVKVLWGRHRQAL